MNQIFPSRMFETTSDYAEAYFECMARAVAATDFTVLNAIAQTLADAVRADQFIYLCGNGGSAGIANHSLCDMLKCVCTDTDLKPRVMSLAAHTEMNSALANDISYDEVFAYQVDMMGRSGDVLLTVSSSGDSENVVRALHVAQERGLRTISFTGFAGGRSRDLAELNAHVEAQNYGVIEDMHMSFMHILSQHLRMSNMDPGLVGQRKF